MFIEIILAAHDMRAAGLASRDDVEEPLEEALDASGLGAVTGGGGHAGMVTVDVEVEDAVAAKALALLKLTLVRLHVPGSVVLALEDSAGRRRMTTVGEP